MGLASLVGWLAAFGILIVGICRFFARQRAVSAGADKSPAAQRKAVLRQDFAYLTRQAANVSQLQQMATASGSELDKHLEMLERREFVDDAARFIVAARAEGSKEFSKGADRIRDLLRSLGLPDSEFEQALSGTAEFQEH